MLQPGKFAENFKKLGLVRKWFSFSKVW